MGKGLRRVRVVQSEDNLIAGRVHHLFLELRRYTPQVPEGLMGQEKVHLGFPALIDEI
jgi:hypothetical protein